MGALATMAATGRVEFLACGIAGRVYQNGTTSGDGFVLTPNKVGGLLAVFDGLGHGQEAADAAGKAADVIGAHCDDTMIALVRRTNEALIGTRGVALSLINFNRKDEAITWLGVGNVEAVLIRADQTTVPRKEHIVMRGGVVGSRLPPLQAAVTTVNDGDVLIAATDGIRRGFSEKLDPATPPQKIADSILASFGKEDDDALVLVARYIGRRIPPA